MIVTGFPYIRDGRINDLLKPLPKLLKDFQAFRRLGSAAIDLAYVACGRMDAFYEEGLKPWDTAAGMILVEEAGGRVTDYFENSYNVYNNNILATNGLIHPIMKNLLQNVNF